MNNQRRKELQKAIAILQGIEDQVSEAKSIIEQCRDDEQEYIDNLPENLQQSDRAQMSEAAVSALDTALEGLGVEIIDIIDSVEEATA